jgi:hypothetical protein
VGVSTFFGRVEDGFFSLIQSSSEEHLWRTLFCNGVSRPAI